MVVTRSGVVAPSAAAAAVPAAAARVVSSTPGKEPGVVGAAAAAAGAHEVLGELVQKVAAVAHPHRPLHAELGQGHGVARTPVAEHEATIPGIFRLVGYTKVEQD